MTQDKGNQVKHINELILSTQLIKSAVSNGICEAPGAMLPGRCNFAVSAVTRQQYDASESETRIKLRITADGSSGSTEVDTVSSELGWKNKCCTPTLVPAGWGCVFRPSTNQPVNNH